MQNVMIDLETLGTRPGSAVLAIGAVFFDANGLGYEFYKRVTLESCLKAGLKMDASTVLWWMGQEDAARRELYDKELMRNDLREAMGAFSDFLLVCDPDDLKVWGNGSDFDIVLMLDCYEAVGLQAPWKFYNHRCYRTLKSLAPHSSANRARGVHHNGLDDAKSQALHAIQVATSLGLSKLLTS
jgi:hypothetical protein